MAKYDGYTLEILNWEKYNPRFDSKKPSWFRMEANFATSQEYFGLTPAQKWAWIVIMCSACQSNGKPLTLRYDWLKVFTELDGPEIDDLIDFLIEKDSVCVTRAGVARAARVSRNSSHATNERTDERTNREIPPSGLLEESELGTGGRPDLEVGGSGSAAVHWLAQMWNDICGEISTVRATKGPRLKHIRARLQESPDEAHWREVFVKISVSPFCRGENDKGWRASFDWVLQPDVQWKVLEGKYDTRRSTSAIRPPAAGKKIILPYDQEVSGES
jgi:hypothetical protein